MVGEVTDPGEDLSGVRFDVVNVEIQRPTRWWLASRLLLSEISDPDVDDGVQRHADRDELRWHILGDLLTGISRALQEGDYVTSKSDELSVVVDVDHIDGGLTLAEAEVLDSWFSHQEAPRADGWSLAPANGRHRLWNVWRHSPQAIVPVRSVLLDFTDEIETEYLARTIRDGARVGLGNLPAVIEKTSPAYVAEIRQALNASPRA